MNGAQNTTTADHIGNPQASGEPAGASATRPPVVLQVLPALVTGGAERGAIDVAAALHQAGGTPLVASAGGPMARELERWRIPHFTLPLDSKNPLVDAAGTSTGSAGSSANTTSISSMPAAGRRPGAPLGRPAAPASRS